MEFDWDEHNERHVREHGIDPAEAEEALLDPRRIGAHAVGARAERRWGALGATEEGRVLFVVFTYRRRDVRVVTARDTDSAEKRRYRRRGK